MSSRLTRAGKAAGVATIVIPTIRRLSKDTQSLPVIRDLRVSAADLRRERRRTLVAGSIIGTMAGFAAGVLLAPRLRKGKVKEIAEETRLRASDTVDEVKQKVTETAHDVREKVEETTDEVRGKVGERAGDVSEKVEQTAQDVQTAVTKKAQEVREQAQGTTAGEPNYFKGIRYPIGRRELRVIVANNGAPEDLLDKIDRLPDQGFRRWDDISIALGGEGYQPLQEERHEQRGAA